MIIPPDKNLLGLIKKNPAAKMQQDSLQSVDYNGVFIASQTGHSRCCCHV